MSKLIGFAEDGMVFPGRITHLEVMGRRLELDSPLEFTYVPATALDANRKYDEAAKEDGTLGENEREVKATVKLVASHLKSWNRKVPISEESVRRATAPMLNRLNQIIQGLQPSDGTSEDTPEKAAGNS